MPNQPDIAHPHDTPLSSGFRFLSELIAWVAGPWAASQVHPILAVLVLLVLIGLPTVFSNKGDKRHTIVDTPGPLRILIELLRYLVAAVASWFIWLGWIGLICVLVVVASLVLGFPRMRWLAMGAPRAG